jgi:hypothetical protein
MTTIENKKNQENKICLYSLLFLDKHNYSTLNSFSGEFD